VKKPQFIVMSYPRTGSTLVCDSLGKHPDLSEAMEVFHESRYRHHLHQEWRETTFLELFNKNPEEISVFGATGNPILDYYNLDFTKFAKALVNKVNGFKLLYHQVPVDAPFWDFFLNEVPLKIIYMKRDFFDACVSFYLSKQTGVWQRFSPNDDIPEPSITLTTGNMQEFYRVFYQVERDYCSKFSGVDSIVVDYEELSRDFSGTMLRVQDFLGVSPMELPQDIYKKATKPTRELVSNYDSLMETFRGLSPLSYISKQIGVI
jgi:LPS sulfotransferase NodH